MGLYENGVDTRKNILRVCSHLFLEKGYHATSIEDICREAHVNRGSIYYHFKDKENIRYEVHWEHVMRNLAAVRQNGEASEYDFILVLYLLWYQLCTDAQIRRFHIEYFGDFPVFSPKKNLSRSVMMMAEHMYGQVLPVPATDKLTWAILYGYFMSTILLTESGEYAPMELFRRSFYIGNQIRGVSQEDIDRVWEEVQIRIRQLPEAVFQTGK